MDQMERRPLVTELPDLQVVVEAPVVPTPKQAEDAFWRDNGMKNDLFRMPRLPAKA